MRVKLSAFMEEEMRREAEMDKRRASIGAQKYQGVRKMLAQGKTDSEIMHIADITPETLIRWKRQLLEEKGTDMPRYPKTKMDEVRELLRAGEDPGVISQTTGVKLSIVTRTKDEMETAAAEEAAAAKVSGIAAPPAASVVDETPEPVYGGPDHAPEAPEPVDDVAEMANAEPAGASTDPVEPAPVRRCRVCGCTDDHACPGGCWWVEQDLCSACVGNSDDQADVLPFVSTHTLPVPSAEAKRAAFDLFDADPRRRFIPFWNAHVCQDMPRDLRIVRENLLDPYIVTDDNRFIGPIRLCPWCGSRPEEDADAD